MAQILAPLPLPGFSLHSGFMATKGHTFVAKGRDSWSDKASFLVSYASPTGEAIAPFLEIVEEQKKQISFRTMEGQEVMRIVKQTHAWGFKPTTYHGMRSDGVEAWSLKLKQNLSGTQYQVTINGTSAASSNVMMQNKVNGAEKGVLINGQLGASMSRHEVWSHMHRIDLINVAPGMDILFALGLNWIRADKQKQEEKAAISAAT
ncbi:hypothetical protein CC86DRAFT_459364 [Ophiobolus disseminans]|uniref:Tubby C-terminal domain-containing protein n=1 Tax=Ophiobolus disseminans TaxID=1469910 RepID=A0A6A6ZKN9_9PLEO|nr:hypothetical protein CC86DRAFT_459364 [Ophiobolus disseminans]